MEEKPFYKYYKDEKDEKRSQKIFVKLVVTFFVFYLIIMGLSFVFYQNFSYYTIAGKSMQSTLNPNPVLMETDEGADYYQDGVYIHRTQDLDYNDIIIIKKEKDKEKTIVKRVIALEGDYVTIVKLENVDEFRVFRVKQNSNIIEVLEEDYIYSYADWTFKEGNLGVININGINYQRELYENFTTEFDYQTKSFEVKQLGGKEVTFFKVEEESVFVLGDNRGNSNDSCDEGYYDISLVQGKVVDLVRDGTSYKGNNFWWFNRLKGFFRVIWSEILAFFGANG